MTKVREIYATCLGQEVTESEEFQVAWKLISAFDKEELMLKMNAAIAILKGNL